MIVSTDFFPIIVTKSHQGHQANLKTLSEQDFFYMPDANPYPKTINYNNDDNKWSK